MHGSLLVFLSLHLALPAIARNITIDNESPQVVYSPPPCFSNNTNGCSPEWQRRLKPGAFNGSVTLTAGSNSSQIPDVLPRVSLTFRGTGIVFMPGMHSSAQATVIVDDRPSVFLNTSESAFEGIGLDPQLNHTISVTFVPNGDDTTTLDVDYFLVTQPDVEPTSTTSSSLFTTALPTIPPPTNTIPAPISTPVRALAQSGIPTGTIAAVSLSGALVLVLGILVCLCATRRRRRRAALSRERAILYDLQLPSEREGNNRRNSLWRAAWRDSYAGAMAWRNSFAGARGKADTTTYDQTTREKGKAREPDPLPLSPPLRPESELLEWRIASPPPASLRVGRAYSSEYTPWP